MDHGGLEVVVSAEFVGGADVGAGLEKVGCEAVAGGMGNDVLVDARFSGGGRGRPCWMVSFARSESCLRRIAFECRVE